MLQNLQRSAEVKQPTSGEINTIKASVAQMYGFTFDSQTNSVRLGNQVLEANDPRLVQMANDERDAVNGIHHCSQSGG